LFFRFPLAVESAGALAWPGVKRQRVRDDHPFLQAVELGIRYARFPATDLDHPLLRERLSLLNDEGVDLTAIFIDAPLLDLAEELKRCEPQPDTVELHLPGLVFPDDPLIHKLKAARAAFKGDLCLAPYLPRERAPGRYHPRGRLGYKVEELEQLNTLVGTAGFGPIRILAAFDGGGDPVEAIHHFSDAIGKLSNLSGFDFVYPLPDEKSEWGMGVAKVMEAAFQTPGIRLYLDPFIDLDRTNDFRPGMLDRLGNPKPIFHLVRCLNSVLGDQPGSLIHSTKGLSANLEGVDGATILKGIDLGSAASREAPASEWLSRLEQLSFPLFFYSP
jgi:hypothetical protein